MRKKWKLSCFDLRKLLKNHDQTGGGQENIPGMYAGVGGYFLYEKMIFSKKKNPLFGLKNTYFGNYSSKFAFFILLSIAEIA